MAIAPAKNQYALSSSRMQQARSKEDLYSEVWGESVSARSAEKKDVSDKETA